MDLTDTFFNWPVFKGAFPLLLEGLGVTVLLGLVSIVSGLVSGLLMALLRLYGPPPLRMLARGINPMVGVPVGVGTEVVLWGRGAEGAHLPADEVAQSAGTIAYELLCAVAPRVPFAEPV